MIKSIFNKILGDRHEREAKKLAPLVDEINAWADRLSELSEEELKQQTEKLRARVRERTADLEAELAELRETKRKTEDADERERLQARIVATERSEEHTSELQSRENLVCRLLLEK